MPHYGHLVRLLHWCTDQVMTRALEEMELTSAQGRILGYISHCSRPPCPRDVEEAFQLSHPTVSGLLSRLEQKGFLTLEPDPDDRRCKRICIQAKGIQCQELMHRTIRENEQRMVHNFTEEEQALFQQLLQRAIENMGHSPCNPISKKEEPMK